MWINKSSSATPLMRINTDCPDLILILLNRKAGQYIPWQINFWSRISQPIKPSLDFQRYSKCTIKAKLGSVRLITGFWSGWYFHLLMNISEIFRVKKTIRSSWFLSVRHTAYQSISWLLHRWSFQDIARSLWYLHNEPLFVCGWIKNTQLRWKKLYDTWNYVSNIT